ncbi:MULTISPECIES: alpha/beta fold hydrolase [Streptomyces]|uniref:Alpha/beta hydrolase n=1 Tax=Streptomyces yangpuensis TaxID=1648182 RepID=A0ABY5Q6C7_9ACTN|nr:MULTISPECIES: alpha/beta hydrolase [Streptomyces]MBZ9599428.1 alpha/beta hydrolase [Streptomyces erythrochromogenes]UUY51170.1 alpha/beta hydrolase [Streptomyces yangpuensis]
MSGPRDTARTTGRTPSGTPYTVHGTGPHPVVLIAGAGGTGRVWEHHQVPALTAAGHRVITFDHGPEAAEPGTAGRETVGRAAYGADAAGPGALAARTVELLAALDLPPCPLVGHSLGALAVQELLLTDAHRVSGALLAATRGRSDVLAEALARAETAAAYAGTRPPPAYEAFVRLVMNLSPRTLADEGAAAEWLDLFELAALTGESATADRPLPPLGHRPADYGRIPVPVLVVGFADDVLAPAPLGREVAAAIPGARYAELADAGHLGFLERPDAFNALLLDFLTTLAPTDPGVSHAP